MYLATDRDREGEAIAWHVMESAEMDPARTQRVVFQEITKSAIEKAFSHPHAIDMDQVNAQQARRILDRLVGYKLSPLLWRKVRGRLSAGRVQSVAVRLVVEREREIDAFDPEEYWSMDAELARVPSRGSEPRPFFKARLLKLNGADPELTSEGDRGAARGRTVARRVGRGKRASGPADAPSGGAVYDQHPAAGSVAQAQFRHLQDHARRAAAL